MSQRSSPKSPRSKSPSCQEEGEIGESGSFSRGRVIDEMQRDLEEELGSSERFISAASGTKGSQSYSRPGSAQDGARSRNASPLRSNSRPPSGYGNEVDLFHLPSPPRTLSGNGSRGVSPGLSQRNSTRFPTSEYSRSKSRTGSPFPGSTEDSGLGSIDVECDMDEPPDDLGGIFYLDRATSYSPKDRWTRGPSEVTEGSHLNSVHFVSSRQQSAESRATRGQTTCPASREMMDLASAVGSTSAVSSASAAGYSTSLGTTSRLTCVMHRPEPYSKSGSLAPGVSATSKKQFSYREGSRLEQTCRPDCKRYLDEVEKTTVAVGPSKASLRSPVPGPSENLKQRNLGPLYSQEISQAGPEHSVHFGGRGITSARTHAGHELFMKGPQMPGKSHVHHHHHHERRLQDEPGRDDRAMAALTHLSQLKKTPSYLMCGVNQNIDFFNICDAGSKSNRLPERPSLQEEELAELIKCERQDVESARYLASEERRTYKKPCPKQQRAQMNVRAIVKAHANQTVCGEKYAPLEHPDPEDISPEVAASMMFSQEQGIKMDGCPKSTILHLFPDEFKQPFPEKIPRSSISIVDPNQKDQEEMMEKSAGVPSEGVSDSAYTRTMKEKGEDLAAQKSYDVDFAIGQSKREYVLVAQKPQRFSKVQFRGGNLPSWFPGYFSAFPDENGGIKSVSSPSGVFQKAWFHANPRNMPTNDVIVLD